MARKNRAFLDGVWGVTLTTDGGGTADHEVALTLRDTLRYEQMEKRSPLAGVGTDGMTSQLATLKLVWFALRRVGIVQDRRFEDFESRVLDMWTVDEDADDDEDSEDEADPAPVELPDPTQSEPSVD